MGLYDLLEKASLMAAIGRFQKGDEIFYAKVVDGELFRLRGDVFGSPSFDKKATSFKGLRTLTPVGPYVETQIDPHDLTIQLFQNGQLRQNSNTSQLIFNCYDLVAFVSTNMTLLPGDIILTGTPSGVGPIESGDRLEVRIQG